MLKTFRIGGIRLKENKLSAGKSIQPITLPSQVTILLGQHIGAPCQPVVKRGEKVKVGTLIGKRVGLISANIHSSVSGKVVKIDKTMDVNGNERDAVSIDVEGDEWGEDIDVSDTLIKECELSSEDIIDKIASAGIVGMGGATFPTHVKLMPVAGTKIETIIVNGAESEPYMTSDHALMLEKTEEILVGTILLMRAAKVEKAIIAIENNKKDAIHALREKAKAYFGIEIVALKNRYPQGSEKQLVEAVLRCQISSGALPASVGAIVQNVATVFAIYEAVQKNKPLVERIVTVTGKDVENPANVRSRIGISVGYLVDFAGGFLETTGKVLAGGPMMGKALVNLDVPVVKGMAGILLIPSNESQRQESMNCIRCAKCVDVCPMGLNPTFLMKFAGFEDWGKAEKNRIVDCIECGACSYVCPANRPLLDCIRRGKGEVMRIVRYRKD